MTGRDLTTTRAQVFGDVECGTECRICGRDVDDGRAKTCSDYCRNLLSAVMGMLNWQTVRRRVIERDDETCRHCGYDQSRDRLASDHVRDIIQEELGPQPAGPSPLEIAAGEDEDVDYDELFAEVDAWNERRRELREQYGDPYEHRRDLEVDHITPIADGGHPFDPGNLQTLCSECHTDKTASENRDRPSTPTHRELNESLFSYAADGGTAGDDEGGGRGGA